MRKMRKLTLSVLAPLALTPACLFLLSACGPGSGANSPNRTPLAEKWFTRAQASYHNGDFDDASQAARSAFDASPSDPEIRLLSARLALASLDYGKAAKLTEIGRAHV